MINSFQIKTSKSLNIVNYILIYILGYCCMPTSFSKLQMHFIVSQIAKKHSRHLISEKPVIKVHRYCWVFCKRKMKENKNHTFFYKKWLFTLIKFMLIAKTATWNGFSTNNDTIKIMIVLCHFCIPSVISICQMNSYQRTLPTNRNYFAIAIIYTFYDIIKFQG